MSVTIRARFTRCICGALAMLFAAFPLAAQTEPSGGDSPLKQGEAVTLSQQVPQPREPSEAPSYVRAVVLPMATPDSPIRVRLQKPVDLARSTALPTNLYVNSDYHQVRGAWQWQDPNELRFVPSKGSVREGDYVTVQIRGTVLIRDESRPRLIEVNRTFQVEGFQMGSKVGANPVVPGSPQFVAFLDSGTRSIGAGPLYILYDQPVDPQVLGSYVSFSVNGRNVPIHVSRPTAVAFDPFGAYDTANILAVTLDTLPSNGTAVSVVYPVSLIDQMATTDMQGFTIQTDFRWVSSDLQTLKSGSVARLESHWELGFSNPIDASAFVEGFSITPRPPSLSVSFNTEETQIYIDAEFDVGKLYAMKLDPAFTDMLGNRLREPLSFSFRSQDLPAVLELPAYSLLLETGSNRLPVKYRNLKNIEVATFRFASAADYVRALEAPGSVYSMAMGNPPVIKVQPADSTINTLYQADFGIGGDPGFKLLEVRGGGRGSETAGTVAKRILVQTSNLGISAKVSDGAVFAWVTRIDNTVPVAGAKIQILDARGTILGSATTVGDGTAVIRTPIASGSELDRTLYVSASAGGDASLCRLANNELSGAWQFNLPGAVKNANPLAAALFTDRGAYRPGETVHLKAFIRDLPEYAGAPDPRLVIHDPRGQEAFNKTSNLDAYHGCAWDFPLADGAAVGSYSVDLMLGDYLFSQSFRVEEYRVPTFQVSVSSDDATWSIDEPVTVHAAATYLKGGKLDGRAFSWRVYRQPETFAPVGFPGYVFTLERDLSSAGTVYDESGTLNADGEATLTFTPDQSDDDGPMLYIAQASVTDTDRQNYAGRMAKVVHATSVYAGVRPPPKAIYRSGEIMSFPFVVTDSAGKILPDTSVYFYLDTLQYNQNTMLDDEGRATTYNREVISTVAIGWDVSGLAPKDFPIKLGEAGYYRLRAETGDASGRKASTGFVFTVSGEQTVAWPRFDMERIDILLDKPGYHSGERAVVVPQSPFTTARGMVTIEANGVLDRYMFTVDRNTPSVSFPVKGSYAPNAYVSVILVRGRVHWAKDATGFETGAPAYRIGYASMQVDPSAQRLSVAMDQKTVTSSPAQPVTLSFQVKDPAGKPSEASATVMVVDEAVLGMTSFATPDPVSMAYAFRVLSVRNASNLLDLPHARRARFEALFPGGDADMAAKMLASDDVLRKLFKSTAYYNPAVVVGPDGKASVTFTMPDNLTTYRVMVVAANKKSQMGSTQSALLTRKSLVVEPVLPRFVYEGDTLDVQARVFNSTSADGTATVAASFTGLDSVNPLNAVRLQVKKSGSALATYRVTARAGTPTVSVKFSVVMGSLTDAVEYSIPMRVRGNTQVSVANGIISGSGTVELPLPAQHSKGTVEVVLSQTPLSELKDSVQYLMGYPNGCIEQTTSTAYPLVVLKDLLPAIGVQVSAADLKKYSEAGVARILSFQTSEGGLSYWPGGNQPHAFATAFGLTALIEAKKRGYNVPDDALKGMGDFLEKSLKSGQITGEMPHGGIPDGDTRALFVMTLTRLGRPQPAMVATLWQARDNLTPFGLAFLAIAVKESRGDQSLLQPILAAIRKAATEKTDEAFFDGAPKGGYSFDSPLRTDAGTLVAYAVANNDVGMAQKLLKGLLNRRRGGLWGNTQENVFGIMGIYQLVSAGAAASSSGSPPGLTVTINGKSYPSSAFEKNSIGVLRLTLPEATFGGSVPKLTVQVNGGSAGSAYVTVRATYDVPIDTAFLGSRSQGFTYTRTYETLDGKSLDGKTVPLGTLLRVRLIVNNQSDRHYVAVDDLLPAGFEPLNANLATTQTVDMGPLSDVALKTQSVVSYSEIRDHRVAFYADELLTGTYEFVYLARATTAGTFFKPVGRAEAMYAPEQYGTTGGGSITIQ